MLDDMKKLVTIALTIAVCFALHGQSRVYKGTVIDAEYFTQVAYAAVYIQNTRYGTVANNVGEFSFEAPDSLTNTQLVIARGGFNIQYLPLVGDAPPRLRIALQPDNFEAKSKSLQDSLIREAGGFADFLSRAVNFVTGDWIPLGNPEANRFDFGRIQTLVTYNRIEGPRLRAGLASNSRLSPRFFVKGYAAYGLKDQRLKYRGEAIYSFTEKAYHEEEFPKNNLQLVYENDLYSPGEMHPRSPNNQLFITYMRSNNEATYRNFSEINHEREYKNGLATTFWMRRSRFIPQGTLQFDRQVGNMLFRDEELRTTDVGVMLRYSAREAYDQRKRKRIPLEVTSPVFFLSHTLGLKDFLGGEVPYHRTEFSAQKRFLLGNSGRLDVIGEAMKVWNEVPFPLLVYPNQRYRHHIESNAFFLTRSLEFVADEQVTFRMTFVGDELLLAKVRLLDRLGFRELVTLRGAYGRLSDKNRPGISTNTYFFPTVSRVYENLPYVEGAIGITNILGLLRVEYVHRFTYRDHPDALLGTFRVDITL